MGATTGTRIIQVATVGIPVTDQERALEFYVGRLGFEKRMDAPFGNGLRWIEVAPPGAQTSIALLPGNTRNTGNTEDTTGVDTGIRLTTEDADADHASMAASGVDTDPEVMRWPGVPPMFSFRDLDGNTLYIVQGS